MSKSEISMQPVKFTFDDDVEWEGFAAGGTWNGFDNVKVTHATALRIDAHFRAQAARHGWSFDDDSIAALAPDADGLIDLSDGYATVIVDDAAKRVANRETYTVGDLIGAMQKVVEKHLINQTDREALLRLSRESWIQLAMAAMFVSCERNPEFPPENRS